MVIKKQYLFSETVQSRWQGDCENLVRTLFQFVKKVAPSIVFVDEIDGLCANRSTSDDATTNKVN